MFLHIQDAFRATWHHLCGCFIDPDDSFALRTRKIFAFMSLLAISTCLPVPWWWYRAVITQNGPSPSPADSDRAVLLWGLGAIYGSFTVAALAFYFHTRFTRRAGPVLTTIVLTFYALTIGMASVCIKAHPVDATFLAVHVAALLCQIGGLAAIPIGLAFIFMGIRVVNECFGYPWMLPGYYDESYRSWGDTLYVRSCGITCVGLALLGFWLQRWESMRNVERAERAAGLARRVAALLAQYDTDGCRTEVADYLSTDQDTCDPELAEATLLIVSNLEKYRPHLPNYLIDRTSNSSDEGESCVGNESGREPKAHNGPREDDRLPVDTSSPHTSRSDTLSAQGGSARHRQHPFIHVDPSSHHHQVEPPRNSMLTSAHGTWKSVSSVALGEFEISACDQSFDAGSADRHNELVCRIHALSQSFHASLHSFVGDTLTVSWGATRRVAQSETKALKFASGLKEATGGALPSTLHGAIVTSCGFARTAGDEKLQMFCVALPDRTRSCLLNARSSARELRTVVCDAATRDTAKFTFALPPVDVIAVDDADELHRFVELYELCAGGRGCRSAQLQIDDLPDRPGDGSDGEWMYQLVSTSAANDAHDKVVREALAVASSLQTSGAEVSFACRAARRLIAERRVPPSS